MWLDKINYEENFIYNNKEFIENFESEYINNILLLREKLKIRKNNLSKLFDDKNNNNEKKI